MRRVTRRRLLPACLQAWLEGCTQPFIPRMYTHTKIIDYFHSRVNGEKDGVGAHALMCGLADDATDPWEILRVLK